MAPLEKTVALGVPKLVWFSTLKNSARNCRLARSAMAVLLNSEASTSARPGPLYTPRPKFPYVPAVGSLNAAGLNHWFGLPNTTGPEKAGLREGRSGFLVSPSPDRFDPICGVNGNPSSSETIVLNCQPLTTRFPKPPRLLAQA